MSTGIKIIDSVINGVQKLWLLMFPIKLKLGDLVICDDIRCQDTFCTIDRVYYRGNNHIKYFRLKYINSSGVNSTLNIKASRCQQVKR
mgnify:CR=1 FL=1